MSDEDEDCPLCLLPLEPYDDAHPLQCPSRHCDFNCCMGCLEQMIKSTKDEKIEASDGNTFRVFLHCPNCRSNLGPSIRDTVLLRKVDKYSKQTLKKNSGDGTEVVDVELSASELRFRYALEKDEDVASAIQAAQHREDEFFGRGAEAEEKNNFLGLAVGGESITGSFGKESVWSFDDEEGVEADLLGPHKSFIFRHHSVEDLNNIKDEPEVLEDVPIDTTLLCGLEAFMTEQEQQFMTEELVSGDPERIAAATETMHYVSALGREGMRPSMKRQQSSMSVMGRGARGRLTKKSSMMESVRQIIREGSEARKREEEKEARRAVGAVAAQLQGAPPLEGGVAGRKRNMHRMVEIEMKKRMEYMKLHPLPLRMPKYAEVASSKAEASRLTFVDDTWDGTVLDAFSKITVRKSLLGSVTVSKQHAESMGIRRVIDAGSPTSPRSNGRGYIDTVRPRVLVASINRELGRQGVVKGDVLTHFNGEPFSGTASELAALIGGKYEGEVLTFVFNADSAVAEALKRRAMILDDAF